MLDNNYATWGSYGNRYWPEDYLIDIDGFIVDHHIGEGDYDTTEMEIQKLLKERADALGIRVNISNTTGIPSNVVGVDFSKVGSPETYFGSARNQYLGNGKTSVAGLQMMEIPASISSNVLYLGGTWNFTDQYAETRVNDTAVFRYSAKNVYFVASSSQATEVRVMLDGKPITSGSGSDVSNSVVVVGPEQLYTIVQGADYGEHTLELDFAQPGLRAYTFTFG